MLMATLHNNRTTGTSFGRVWLLLLGSLALLAPGCAAVTNPTANGVPAHMLPNELLAPTKEDYVPVDLTLLRVGEPEVYTLDIGDTLGIYVEGVVGDANTPPPVNIPDSTELPPSIGYPFPVRDDGAVSLPMVGSIPVKGMTIEEAEKAVIQAYLDSKQLNQQKMRVVVSLMRPRYVRVIVVREDQRHASVTRRNSSLIGLGASTTRIGGAQEPSGQIVELPAYQNDLLNALARTGGLPAYETRRDVLIYRGEWEDGGAIELPCSPSGEVMPDGKRITQIPLRVKSCQPPSFSRDDVILNNGDIVVVRGLEPEVYYTGGLMPSMEMALPTDKDITVLEAVLRAQGQLLSGGISPNNLNGSVVGAGIGNPSPSQLAILRKTPGKQQVMIRVDLNEAIRDPRLNILVQADDVLLLQESTDEAASRYFSDIFQADLFLRFMNHRDGQGSASVIVP